MPASRRGSGSIVLPSGQTMAMHTRTHDEEDLPHATKKTMADHLRKFESLFTLTPQRMRMIVDAFTHRGTASPSAPRPSRRPAPTPSLCRDSLAT
ncbi:hypothetical protein C8R43DRAFT_444194 [Mycena crocata]|nr:hypothetical protein C8R43DRAFT_444194 [Mycena crocata]